MLITEHHYVQLELLTNIKQNIKFNEYRGCCDFATALSVVWYTFDSVNFIIYIFRDILLKSVSSYEHKNI